MENEKEVKEEIKKEDNKNSSNGMKKMLVVVIILVLTILGLVGYITYDKLLSKEEPKTTTETNNNKKEETPKTDTNKKEENRELTKEEQEIFDNKIENLNSYFSKYFPLNNAKTVVSNDELLLYALIKIGFDKESFTGNDVNKIIKETFGNSVSVTNKDIICAIDNEPFYKYNAVSNTYTKTDYNHGHSGPGFMETKNYIESANIKDEKTVTINTKIVYVAYRADIWGPTSELYKTYLDAEKGQNPIYVDETEDGIEVTDSIYQKIKDKLPTTTYTFEKNSEGYYDLISVAIN